jgi:uncharacterized protein (TIGR02001 family)
MKQFLKPLSASIAAAVIAAASFAPTANAELSASAGVASMYLWRGLDLGDGSPAVYGDLKYSIAGAYAGIWGSSGDSTLGNEYDLFAGYGGEVGGFSYDLSVWNYNYSDYGLSGAAAPYRDDTIGELTEVILTLGYGPVTFQYYDNVAGSSGYEYYTLAASVGQFTLKAGYHDFVSEAKSDMTHLDLTYAFNDNLSFTFSKVVDEETDGTFDDDLIFMVSYSLPVM